MIIKNEEKYLRDCLRSVEGIVDEIIIVDTGSSDKSLSIAEEFNAKIFQFKWTGDFSAARNFSLEQATGDWILYLDADERLNKNSEHELKRLTARPDNKGYRCNVISPDDTSKHPSIMSYSRLFPGNDKLRFSGKIHEQIEPSLIENNIPVINSSIEIIHLGYNVSEEEKKKKAERNLELLLNEYSQSQSGYYAFQLGQTLGILKRPEEAEKYFEVSLKDHTLQKEYKALAYRYLAINYAEKKRIIIHFKTEIYFCCCHKA